MDKILILDFGSQVTQLIARRVREAGVYCELHPQDVDAQFIREFGPKGIILSGSHASAYESESMKADPYVFEAGVPVLGSRCPGLREVLHDTPSRTFATGDVSALECALREALACPWRDEAVAFAPQARARFDNGRSARRLVELYRAAVASTRDDAEPLTGRVAA